MTTAPDVTAELERSLFAFDAAEHAALLVDREDAAAQTLAGALCYATDDAGAATIRAALGALRSAGLGGVFRVTGTRGDAVALMMGGTAKTRSSELRDEVIATLERAGLQVTRRGCWDVEVRR